MDFKTYYRNLSGDQRKELADKIGTSVGYCHQIAYGKHIELGLADAIAAATGLQLDQLPLTERARTQDRARKSGPMPSLAVRAG